MTGSGGRGIRAGPISNREIAWSKNRQSSSPESSSDEIPDHAEPRGGVLTPAGPWIEPLMTDSKSNKSWLLGTLLIVAIAPSIGSLAGLWIWTGTLGSMIYAVCKTLLYGVPAYVAWRTISRKDLLSGWRSGTRLWAILLGTLSGLVIGGGIVMFWFAGFRDTVDTNRLLVVMMESGLNQPTRFWLFAAWLTIGNSLLEEFVFRWFVDSRLKILGLPFIIAIPISALIFTIHHVIVLAAFFDPRMVLSGSVGVFIGGLIWSVTLRLCKSVIPGWISHALVDLAIVLVGASILGLI